MIASMAKPFGPYDYIIRLEARIVGIEPAINRTLELPRSLNFAQLHEVLQAAFGWTDSHLHQFEAPRVFRRLQFVRRSFRDEQDPEQVFT